MCKEACGAEGDEDLTKEMCVNMCVDICVDMCVDMRVEMSADICLAAAKTQDVPEGGYW